MLQGEHSAILLTFINLPFVMKIFVLSLLQEIRTVREQVEQVDSQTVSPELMEQDEQHSPSLLSTTAVEPKVAQPPTQIINKNNVTAANLASLALYRFSSTRLLNYEKNM